MKRLSLVIPALLLAFATPAAAGVVTVGSVTATQYSYPYFTALVQATGTTVLADAHLVVNGTTVVQADKVEPVKLDVNDLGAVRELMSGHAAVMSAIPFTGPRM